MEKTELIEKLSSQMDYLLEEEKKINDFVTEELRKLVTVMLEHSYKKAREEAGFGLGQNIGGLVLTIVSGLSSKPDLITTVNSQREVCEERQNQLDQIWHLAKKRLESYSASELYQVLYLNRTKTFEETISYIL